MTTLRQHLENIRDLHGTNPPNTDPMHGFVECAECGHEFGCQTRAKANAALKILNDSPTLERLPPDWLDRRAIPDPPPPDA